MKFKSQLSTEIKDELETLGKLKVGSDEYRTAVDSVTKLMDRAIELEKLEAEIEKCEVDRENDCYYKDQELKSNKKGRIVRDTIEIASIVVPTVVAIWGTLVTLEFEKEGTVTTFAGRSFISKLFLKK